MKLIGVEPAGEGLTSGRHGATLEKGTPGIFFGARSFNMQTEDGQIEESYSVSAGLDFPSVGRADYVSVTDNEALAAFVELSRREGILPALESSHALAYALKLARANPEKEQKLIVNLSGRGDKDIFTVSRILEEKGLFTEGRLDADAARKLTDCEGGRHD